jgi:glycopeptide antibiotics resistance protein
MRRIVVLWGNKMRVYLNPIAVGIMVSLLIIYLAFIPILIQEYRKYGTLRMRGNLVIASFIVYMITAWFMTILPLPSIEAVKNMKPMQPNFRPFLFVDSFLLSNPGFSLTNPKTWLAAMRSSSFFTVAFNIVLTIPFGVYLRKYFKLSLPWVAVLGFFLSLFYEGTQYTGLYGFYPKAYRFPDVDDLIINTLGAVIGYFFTGCIDRILPNPAKDSGVITEKASLLRRLLALFVDSVLINVLFYLSKVVIVHREWDLVMLLASEAVVFLLVPLLTKNKQTIGMIALRISLKDKNGQCPQTSNILLHNLFVGMWIHFIHGMKGMLPIYAIEMILQLLYIIWIFMLIFKSVGQRKICYYWEPWFDTYIKAYLPNHQLNNSVMEKDKLKELV